MAAGCTRRFPSLGVAGWITLRGKTVLHLAIDFSSFLITRLERDSSWPSYE